MKEYQFYFLISAVYLAPTLPNVVAIFLAVFFLAIGLEAFFIGNKS